MAALPSQETLCVPPERSVTHAQPQRRPRVLIIPEYAAYGGTLSFFSRLLEIHRAHAIETAVLIPHRQAFPEILARCAAEAVRVFECPDRPPLFIRPYVALLYDVRCCWRAYRSFRPDLIVVSNGTPGLMLGALLYSAPVAFVMHTYPMEQWRAGWRRIAAYLSRRGQNCFVTVSHASAQQIHACTDIPMDRIRVVYNSWRRLGDGGHTRQPLVLTIGHVVPYKGPDTWLRVAQRVIAQRPDARFVWLGDGDQLEAMRAEVARLGLADHVALPGYCDDVSPHYAEAMLCFQPSRIDSHNIAVVEAMVNELPCVVSNIGGLIESVVHGETGFTCRADDIQAFSARIIGLLDDADLRARMGSAGQRRALELFSPEAQEENILNLYRAALADRRGLSVI